MLQDIKKTLWSTADKLRANVDAAEYKHIALGLIFLKFISDSFSSRQAELRKRLADESDELYFADATAEDIDAELEDRDYYKSANVFWVPETARWEALRANAKQADIGKRIDDALAAIELENPTLKGILDKRYARAPLPDGKLGELVDLISTIGFGEDQSKARDILGQVYEYFLGQFASAEGKKGGQFYTPQSIVNTLVAVLDPHQGKVYDPCCGSGGMFVQSEKFIEAHGGKLGDVSIYGQESNPTTWRLAAMNLAIRGIDFNLGREPGDTFTKNQHSDLRADYILANPPFNISDWWHGSLEGDPRWVYGTPPQGNANYAWLQHMLYHLKPTGRAGIVLANGSMSSSQNSEGDIRRAMVDADVVEVMVALPGQLFFNTQIPACLWFLTKQKTARKGEVLFIDARKLGRMISRVQSELDQNAIDRIANTAKAWRGEDMSHVEGFEAGYQDIAGFCRSVPLSEIAEHGHVLTPGRYVGAEEVEDCDDAFADKMTMLTEKLAEQMAKGAELDQLIRQKLGGWDMSSNWPTLPLEECLDALIDYRGKTPTKTTSGVPLVTAKVIKAGRIETPTEFIAHEDFESWMRRGMPQPGDVVMTTEAPLGEVAQLGREKVALAQRVITLRGKKDFLDNDYLLYLLLSEEMQDQLKARATGTTVLGIKQSELRKISVTVPPFSIQQDAASVLKAIDSRIAILRETNATLEAIAQALFKSWFVDFDPVHANAGTQAPSLPPEIQALFPTTFTDSPQGPIPEGWSWKTLDEAYEINPKRLLKKGVVAKYLDMASVQTQGHVTEEVIDREFGSGTKFCNGDTLLARITPCLENGKTAFVDFLEPIETGWGSTEFIVLKPKAPLPDFHGYLLARQSVFREFAIRSMSGTSGRQRVQNDVLGSFNLVMPDEPIATAFSQVVTPIQQSISANHKQAKTLANLRDTLLPRLISGQLRLPEIQAAIGEIS